MCRQVVQPVHGSVGVDGAGRKVAQLLSAAEELEEPDGTADQGSLRSLVSFWHLATLPRLARPGQVSGFAGRRTALVRRLSGQAGQGCRRYRRMTLAAREVRCQARQVRGLPPL
ncbi:hypothetical protein GCM10027436_40590 [Actinophytocola sediminis]